MIGARDAILVLGGMAAGGVVAVIIIFVLEILETRRALKRWNRKPLHDPGDEMGEGDELRVDDPHLIDVLAKHARRWDHVTGRSSRDGIR